MSGCDAGDLGGTRDGSCRASRCTHEMGRDCCERRCPKASVPRAAPLGPSGPAAEVRCDCVTEVGGPKQVRRFLLRLRHCSRQWKRTRLFEATGGLSAGAAVWVLVQTPCSTSFTSFVCFALFRRRARKLLLGDSAARRLLSPQRTPLACLLLVP